MFFGRHVCGQQCDGPQGCVEGKGEQGRYARIKSAKEVCLACPERHPCLEWALNTNQAYGIWGGKTERERKVIQKARTQRPLN